MYPATQSISIFIIKRMRQPNLLYNYNYCICGHPIYYFYYYYCMWQHNLLYSIIMIINDIISESLQSSFDNLNVKLQNDLENDNLDEKVISEMKKNKLSLEKKHFRTVTLFNINNLTNNVMEHRLVPQQTAIRDRQEIKTILEENNCNTKQLPIILKYDIISKYLRLSPGDLCKITRKSIKTGEYDFYRICH